jgi:transketolase
MAIIYDGSMDKDVYKNVFSKTLEEVANNDSKVIYLDADLMNSFGTLGFWKRNKKQAVNCGVAEANMIGVAAGLSAAGKKPYVHTFGPFATRRCYDQSFLSVAYTGNSVRIFGSDPGVTAAFNGGTHMPFEDMALMRAIPHSTVIEITDGAMLERIIHDIKDREGLTYVRTTRKSYPAVYSPDHDFQIGKGEVVKDGKDVTIIACGLMVSEALKAAGELEKQGVSVRVVDMFTVKPIDKELVVACGKETKAIVTAENHNIIGGLGDAVSDALVASDCVVPMRKVGVKDEFGSVGPQDYLQEYYGLTAVEIVKAVNEVLKK